MGRWSTGAVHTGQCLQLRIKSFAKTIREGKEISGTLSWECGASISITYRPTTMGGQVELRYSKKDEGKSHDIKYWVLIVGRPSNIGNGRIYSFSCPFSGKRCNTLYMAYGSHYFKSRQAYGHRIYYASQMSSRLDKHNDAYWRLEHRLEKLYPKHPKEHYRGKPTAARQRIERMEKKQDYHNEMRWQVLPVAVSKYMASNGISDASMIF